MALLRRLVRADHPAIPFTLDGEPCEGRAGDTVLTAILTQAERLRLSEFSASPRAAVSLRSLSASISLLNLLFSALISSSKSFSFCSYEALLFSASARACSALLSMSA